MAETKLKPANENPWYVLATIHGEQEYGINQALHVQNRQAWNAWSCQNLSDEETAHLAKVSKLSVDELRAWMSLRTEVEELFVERLGEDTQMPMPEDPAVFSGTIFASIFAMEKFIFTQSTYFSSAKFTCGAGFVSAVFRQDTYFGSAVFEKDANFTFATFKQDTYFSSTIFEQDANFNSATFMRAARFDSATFTDKAYFNSAIFTIDAFFSAAIFTQGASFNFATFTQAARFRSATFTQDAWFASATFMQTVRFDSTTFTQDARFDSAVFSGFVYFLQTRFEKEAIFTDCHFEKPTIFRNARFDEYFPLLDGAVLHVNTTFTARDSGDFSIASDEEESVANEVRRFWPDRIEGSREELEAAKQSCSIIRHAVGQQGLPEDEHFFFRKEMGFATRIGSIWKRAPYLVYESLSMFGYSIARPASWLVYLVAVLAVFYASYFGSPDFAATGRSVDNRWLAGLGFSASNVLPGFGFGRGYFESGFQAALDWPIKLVAGTQSVLGVALLFFLALGLRTRFRLR